MLADPLKPRLLYIGEITANKNLEETIAAAKILQKSGMDVSLRVVGQILDEKYRAMMEQESFIKYFDKCDQAGVLEHMRQSDLFVMPSHTETFGLVYAEAMSQGLPVLYTRGQGFDGQFPEGTVGYSVSDTDVTDLVEKIKMIITNYNEISSNCVKMVEKFDWNRIANIYENLYKHCINGGDTL